MTTLERLERGILIFLIAALISGIAVSAYRKSREPARVTIEKFNTQGYKSTNDEDYISGEKVDINSAAVEDLMRIKGIGETTASRIVEYRDKNGSFSSIDDIKNVKGVGVALFEKIKSRIKVDN